MGLFGFGSKRSPLLQPTEPLPAPSTDLSATSTSSTAPISSQPAEVEVSELSLDEDEFSSTFGAGTSQFADTTFGQAEVDADPWTSRLRLD